MYFPLVTLTYRLEKYPPILQENRIPSLTLCCVGATQPVHSSSHKTQPNFAGSTMAAKLKKPLRAFRSALQPPVDTCCVFKALYNV